MVSTKDGVLKRLGVWYRLRPVLCAKVPFHKTVVGKLVFSHALPEGVVNVSEDFCVVKDVIQVGQTHSNDVAVIFRFKLLFEEKCLFVEVDVAETSLD